MKLTIIIYVAVWLVSIVGYAFITLDNGQYKDLFVVIQDNVTENEELLNRIQRIFTDASQHLFEATNHRTYFGQIKIVIPKTWSGISIKSIEYKPTPSLALPPSFITIADGKIEDPHVRHSSKCGETGHYMYLTPDFILTEGWTKWGSHANVIVHEWGHLRWGIFDEYPTSIRDKFYLSRGEWKPVRCTENIQGRIGAGRNCDEEGVIPCNVNDATRRLPSNCNFCVDISQDVKASLMGYQFIDKISSFCDDSSAPKELRHNREAPNMQNTFCKGLSAWEVMRKHVDFSDGANPTLPKDTNTTPDFVLLQETSVHIVLALDVSGSMGGNRIYNLKTSCKSLIQNVVENGFLVGIVWFSSSASIRKQLTQINSQQDRDGLIAALPSSVDGYTCIGCGIDKALTVLKDILSNPENGQVIVVSDGENNRGDLGASVKKAVDAKIVVHTIAITKNADGRLRDIAENTGGQHLTYLDLLDRGVSLRAAVGEIISTGASTMLSAAATILSETVFANINEITSFEFIIDSGIGNETKISVLAGSSTSIKVTLTGPNGYTQDSQVTDNSLTLSIPGKAQAGKYSVNITLSASIKLECYVSSKPVPSGPGVIRLLSRLSTSSAIITSSDSPLPVIYASVIMSYAPVVNATVTAHVASDYTSCIIKLRDDGNDPDIVRDDGTYSGYIQLNCMSNGAQATIKVLASADGNSKLGYVNSGAFKNAGNDKSSGTAVDAFQRIALPGDLYITMPNIDTSVDITAPGRITNVQIVDVSTVSFSEGENRNYTITWTATGDDMNVGQATSYDLRISENYDTLVDNFQSADFLNVTSIIPTPLASGETEALKMVVDATKSFTSTAYFAIVAIDNEGNRGSVSNIVSITVATGFKIAATIAGPDNTVDSDSYTSPKTTTHGGSVNTITIIIAVAIPICFILFITIGVLVYKKIHAADNIAMPDREAGPYKTTFKTHTPAKFNNANETCIKTKSNSINAVKLLSASDLIVPNYESPSSKADQSSVKCWSQLSEVSNISQHDGDHIGRMIESGKTLSSEEFLHQYEVTAPDHNSTKRMPSNRKIPSSDPVIPTVDDVSSINNFEFFSETSAVIRPDHNRIKRFNTNRIAPTPGPVTSSLDVIQSRNSDDPSIDVFVTRRPATDQLVKETINPEKVSHVSKDTESLVSRDSLDSEMKGHLPAHQNNICEFDESKKEITIRTSRYIRNVIPDQSSNYINPK